MPSRAVVIVVVAAGDGGGYNCWKQAHLAARYQVYCSVSVDTGARQLCSSSLFAVVITDRRSANSSSASRRGRVGHGNEKQQKYKVSPRPCPWFWQHWQQDQQ